MAVPTTPRIAMPSAPPNSALVSASADAAPARSGGADPTARSVAKVSTGASARENTTEPVTRTASPAARSVPSSVSSPKPTAASPSPPAITNPGRTRLASTGVSMEPRMNPAEAGSIHRPAASGDSPNTSCRYWAMNSNAPNPTKKLSTLVVKAALKAGTRNSRRSSSGSASVCCRRTNTTPTARLGVTELRQQDRPKDQQQRHHRHRQQEHRAPPEPLQQHPTRQRPDRPADREAGNPHRDGDRALPRIKEHIADQRQGRRRHGRAGDPEQRAGGDQHPGAG